MHGSLPRRSPQAVDAHVSVAGVDLLADPLGALVHEAERLLIVADLHFEKGSFFAQRGMMLPPYDTAATLMRLAQAIARHDPRRVVALGDSFHDRGGAARMGAADRAVLAGLMAGRDWLWIAGNHDPAGSMVASDIGGAAADGLALGPLHLRHEPQLGAAPGEIAGHLHPVARVLGETGSVRRRCFVGDGSRVILPAFGAYAGGLNIRDDAFAGLFSAAFTAHVLGRERVWVVRAERCGPGV